MPKYIYSMFVISNLFSQVDYSTQIQPIFNNYCTSCHIDGGAYFGGLDLSSYTLVMEGGSSGNTIVPYEHADSELYQRITLYQSDDQFMPQNGSSLPQSDIDLIAQWIDEGALEVPNTSFQPESNQELQEAVDLWISNIDSALSVYGQINSWDVSLIWDMSYLFKDATNFNDDISNWDVSNVNLMYYMFYNTTSFNQDLSSWDVSNVERMHGMFQGASTFDGDISNWDVSNLTSIYYMFSDAANFNQDISNWDISNTSSLMQMFSGATSFNQDISNWNTENVTSMSQMFQTATSFDQDISNWDISNVQNMNSMFDMFNQISNLSDENKCLIHTAFSSNSAWEYDWSELCELSIYKAQIPNDFIIHQNYPNPFNPVTTLRYDLPEDAFVRITVYDKLGKVVSNLLNTNQSSGNKSFLWDATNNLGQPVPAGLYFFSIETDNNRQSKKMILLK